MESLPPVSIYITTYLNSAERGEVLKATCRNALAQNYPHFEVVVSDNAGSYPAEKALAGIDDSRLRVVRNEENLGQAGNSNKCLEYCRHDIIKVNCDDDLLHPDCLRVTVPYVNDETYVVTDKVFYTIGKIPAGLEEPLPAVLNVETRAPGYRKDFWGYEHVSLPGCCLFTKNLFRALGRFDNNTLLFDYDFLLEARLRRNVVFVRHPLCFMGEWESSLSSQMLQSRPFFFPTGQLYTKFRLLKRGGLKFGDRMGLSFRLLRHFLWESIRVPRYFWKQKYWTGYTDYVRQLLKYMFMAPDRFDFRAGSRG